MFSLVISIQGSGLDLEVPTTPSLAVAAPLTKQDARGITTQIENLFTYLGHEADSDGMRMYFSILFKHPVLKPQSVEHGLHATIFDSESGLSPITILNFLFCILQNYEAYTSMPPLLFFVDRRTGKIQTLDASRRLASDHTMNCRLNEHNGIHPFMNNILAAIKIWLNGEYNCMNVPFLHVALSMQSQSDILSCGYTQIDLPIEGLNFTFETLIARVIFKLQCNVGIWTVEPSYEIVNPLRNPVNTFKRIEDVIQDSKNKIDTLKKIRYYLTYRNSDIFNTAEFYLMIQSELSNEELNSVIGLSVDQAFLEMERIKAELEGMGYHHTRMVQKEFALVGDCENPNRLLRFDFIKRWNAIKKWYGMIPLTAAISYRDEFEIFCCIMREYVEKQYEINRQKILDDEAEKLKNIVEETNRSNPDSPMKRVFGHTIGMCIQGLQKSPLKSRSANTPNHPIKERKEREAKAKKSLTPSQLKVFTHFCMSQRVIPITTEDPTVKRLFEDLLPSIKCS